jgi:hypothetical protein
LQPKSYRADFFADLAVINEADMTILTTQQAVDVGDVTSIVVTDIAQDQESGEYVREIRIFAGEIDTAGPLAITVRLRSQSRSKLHVAVPSLQF